MDKNKTEMDQLVGSPQWFGAKQLDPTGPVEWVRRDLGVVLNNQGKPTFIYYIINLLQVRTFS